MSRFPFALLLSLTLAVGSAVPALAQARPDQPREPARTVKFQPVAEGINEAQIFRTEAFRDVTVEVKDFILAPGKSAPDISVHGFGVTELKSGEVETTIDGQTLRRRPGDFWVVRPGQKYALKSLGGMVVLHTIIFARK